MEASITAVQKTAGSETYLRVVRWGCLGGSEVGSVLSLGYRTKYGGSERLHPMDTKIGDGSEGNRTYSYSPRGRKVPLISPGGEYLTGSYDSYMTIWSSNQ